MGYPGIEMRRLKQQRRRSKTADIVNRIKGFNQAECRIQMRAKPVSNCDHDYYFELLVIEERDAQSITRCSTAHHRDFRAVPRANRT